MAAMGKMSIWVTKVLAERAQLGHDQMDEVIHGMTEPERSDRSTINAAVKALGCGGQEQEGKLADILFGGILNLSRWARAPCRANAGRVRTWSQALVLSSCCVGYRTALMLLVLFVS